MEYEQLFSFYANIIKNKDEFFLLEQKMVSILLKTSEWNQLNDDEKKKAREDKIHWLTSKIYVSTDVYPKFIFYEQSVINFYSILTLVIKKIQDSVLNHSLKTEFTEDEILLVRLYAVLIFEMNLINSTYDLKKITHVPMDILDHLLINTVNYCSEYKLHELKNAFKEMMDLYKANPYTS